MRWTQTADRRDESTPPGLQWVLLLKEERLEMHSTHHNQLTVSSYIYAKKKKKRGLLPFYNSGKESQQAQKTNIKKKKVTWWLLPIFKPHVGHKPDWTGLGSVNVHRFPQVLALHFWETSYSHTHHKSFHQDGRGAGAGGYDTQNMISCLSVQHSHSYILLYNWSLRSTESYHGRIIQHLDSNL